MVKITSYLTKDEATWVARLVGINNFVRYTNSVYLEKNYTPQQATRVALNYFNEQITKHDIPLEYAKEFVVPSMKPFISKLQSVFLSNN